MLEITHIGKSAIHEEYCRQNDLTLLNPKEIANLPDIERLTHLSFQFPGEHCTECAAPDCHHSCDLFEGGSSGLCRRFKDGIVVRRPGFGPFPYSMEILFKNWGRLLSVGNTLCVRRPCYYAFSLALPILGRLICLIQSAFRFLPALIRWKISDKIRGASNRIPRLLNYLAARGWGTPTNALICVVGNPNRKPVTIEIAVSGFDASQGGRCFQRLETLPHGWRFISIPVTEIARVIDLKALFRVTIVPLIEKPTLLQIVYAGFVTESGSLPAPEVEKSPGVPPAPVVPNEKEIKVQKVKVLIVDLDHTLWDGIVLENPEGDYELKSGIRDVLTELDQRGILLSIASKNNLDDVQPILERLGIWDLFLYPQITWQAKSAGIETIVRKLNLGLDAVAFIDDSEFERTEVSQALPTVRVYDANLFPQLLRRDEFAGQVTEESQGRRKLYREEQDRKADFERSDRDYTAFLVSCRIQLVLHPLVDKSLERVQELVQRTNQLNFSGNRYTRQDLSRTLEGPDVIPVVMRCEDRFGNYGIVGFSLLGAEGPTLTMSDLMLSCRIQGKMIEHAYLSYLLDEAGRNGFERLVCNYNRTSRNAPAAQVFEDLKFRREIVSGSRERYTLECGTAPLKSFPATVLDEMTLGARLSAAK